MSEHIVRWFALMRVQEIEVETLAQLPPDKRPGRVLMPLWTSLKADDDGGMHCEGDGQYTIIAAHVSEYDLRVDRQTTEEQARSRWASRRARLRFLRGVPDDAERGRFSRGHGDVDGSTDDGSDAERARLAISKALTQHGAAKTAQGFGWPAVQEQAIRAFDEAAALRVRVNTDEGHWRAVAKELGATNAEPRLVLDRLHELVMSYQKLLGGLRDARQTIVEFREASMIDGDPTTITPERLRAWMQDMGDQLEKARRAAVRERDELAKELAWFKAEDLAIRVEIARAGDGESARAAAIRCRDERNEARERVVMLEAERARAVDERDAAWATAWADAAKEPLKRLTPAALAATASLVFSELETRRKEPSYLKAIAEEIGTFASLPDALEGIRALKGVVVAQERQLGHIRRVISVDDGEATEAAAERLVASLLANLTRAGVRSPGKGAQEYAETIREIVDTYNEQRKCIEKIAGQVGRFVPDGEQSARWAGIAEQGVEALVKLHDGLASRASRSCTPDDLSRCATQLECDPSLDAVLRAAEGWKIKADARQIVINGYTAAARTAVDDPPSVVDPALLRGWIEGLRQDRADLQTIGSMVGLGPAIVETASPPAHQIEWPPGARVIEAVRDLADKAEKDRLEASATTGLSDRIARAKAALEAREGEGLVEAAGRCMAELAAARRELEEMGAEMVSRAGEERVAEAAAAIAADKETTVLRAPVDPAPEGRPRAPDLSGRTQAFRRIAERLGVPDTAPGLVLAAFDNLAMAARGAAYSPSHRAGEDCPLCEAPLEEVDGGRIACTVCRFSDPPPAPPSGSKFELRQILEGPAAELVGRELARTRRLRAALRSFVGDRLPAEQFEAMIDAVRDAMYDGPRPDDGSPPTALRFGDEDVLEMIADDFTDRVAARTAELAADILTGRHRP